MIAKYDYGRAERIGLPEAVLCEGKDDAALQTLIEELAGRPEVPVLLTRLSADRLALLPASLRTRIEYDARSRTGFLNGSLPKTTGTVAIVTAGTSDLATGQEALRTLHFMGLTAEMIVDVGVAGIWRLMERVEDLRPADVIIVVAGMDAALASVIAGMVPQPVIGVPTSVGYGVALGGSTALNAMLASCAQGLLVTNIDNGFGAACAAVRIIGARYK